MVHSGGGNQLNLNLKLGKTSGLWMSYEAISHGLQMRPTKVDWDWKNLGEVKESLTPVWHIFEWLPFKRLSYKDLSSTTYRPNPEGSVKAWADIVGEGHLKEIIQRLKTGPDTEKGVWFHRLLVMSWSRKGSQTLVDQDVIPVLFSLMGPEHAMTSEMCDNLFNVLIALSKQTWICMDEEMVERLLCVGCWENDVKLARWIAFFMERCRFRSVYRNDYLQMLFNQNDSTLISILQSKLTCGDVDIPYQALKVIGASMAHRLLASGADKVQCKAIDILVASMHHDAQVILMIQLRAEDWTVRIWALETLVACLDYNDLHTLIFNHETIATIQGLLADANENVQFKVLDTLVASMDHSMLSAIYSKLRAEDFRVRIYAFKTIYASMAHRLLADPDKSIQWHVFDTLVKSLDHNHILTDAQVWALKTLAASLDHNNLHALIFNPDMISTIQKLLADENEHVQCEALATLVASMDHNAQVVFMI
ncbi:hypothetical protein JB92DRAFT_2838920 [Gautieria morchelliformis]|nr:hypothetical protein JB92DRAFT_2838920 [Gautieria morchelliformis]